MKPSRLALATALAVAVTALVTLGVSALSLDPQLHGGAVPDLDESQLPGAVALLPSEEELLAIDAFRGDHPGAVVRWDAFAGSPDVIYGFASQPSTADAETAARDFLAAHPEIFGVTDTSSLVVRTARTRAALGGHLVRFDQQHAGIPVRNAGFGVVLDGEKRVRAVSGPYFSGIQVDTTPTLGAASAVAAAAGDLSVFARALPADAVETLAPTYDLIATQLGPLAEPRPELAVFPTTDGFRLAWRFFYYSRNPFGLFEYHVDAHSGEVLARESFVRSQDAEPLPFTADYFPTSPPITPELQEDGAIVDENGLEVGRPAGQIRVDLRKFDETNAATGTEGVLTGTHAAIFNALATRLPFEQAALGTWHFAQDDPPLEARTDERDQLAEPAEHQDEISQFIYITSLLEYLDHLHRAGDAAHSPFGQGHFPDEYPNDDTPLTGTVHVPNILESVCGDLPEAADPTFLRRLLACDNAFAIPASTTVAGQEVVVNPTFYGHGWLFNDLALDFAVPLHEGTHATITPIAGFEGSPEGGALNEGQADLFAYTIGENPALGAYIVNGFRLRDLLRDAGSDPDTFAWIRHADSQLRYSQLGTRIVDGQPQFQVHRDGEIYAGSLWDIRQILHEFQQGGPFVRPDPITGEATQAIPLAKETWERLFLGSMYVLGTMSPDTFVRARDAMIIADAFLYPENAVDPQTSGRHRALIEQVFAARELGSHAAPPFVGRQTISTSVSAFTASQAKPPAPQNVTVVPESTDGLRVSWDAVDGALGYQVLKRQADSAAKRLFPGVPGREYFEGDAPEELAGFTHVEYVLGGATNHLDRGQAFGRSPALGLESSAFDYVVRSIAVLDEGQVGFSDLSGTAEAALEGREVTDAIDTAVSDVTFGGGVFAFDFTLTNARGAGAFDGTIYTPITLKVIDISEPSVTVRNADNGGSGQNGDEAHFAFEPSLAVGDSSLPRRLEFDDPEAKLFTFDAIVTGQVEIDPVAATGSQPADGELQPNDSTEFSHFIEQFTGLVPIGTAGATLVEGVDHVDVHFTAKPSSVGVEATLSATPSAGVYPDLDFELFDAAGNQLDSSGNFGPDEAVGGALVGGEDYFFRVVGWANGPSIFHILSDQLVNDPADAGTAESGLVVPLDAEAVLLRFTVDPVSGLVSAEVLQ